jgi:YidC/Oxa1 family membrane protein insertase
VETRRLLLAVVISVAILLLWAYLFPAKPPPLPVPGEEASPPAPKSLEAAPPAPAEEAPAAAAPTAAAAAPEEAAGEPIAATVEEHPVVETDLVRAEFTNRGAQLLSFRVKDHRDAQGEPLELVHARTEGPYPFALVSATGAPLPVAEALFAVERDAADHSLTFRYNGREGRVEKRFRFGDNGLFEVAVDGARLGDWGVFFGPGVRNPTTDELKSRFAVRSLVYLAGDNVSRLLPTDKKLGTGLEIPAAGLRWIGLQDNYFLAVMLAQAEAPWRRAVVTPVLVQPGGEGAPDRFLPLPPGGKVGDEQKDLIHALTLRLEPAGRSFAATCYWGAKQYDRLASLPGGLQRTIDLGWFAVLARPMMIALDWLHDHVVGNYGWAIVLMTIAIKLVLLPLTHKSTVSMRKMQQLNPRMQAVRQKFAGKLKDRQGRPNLEAQRKMNEEIMALYKAEGVNPAGGCLPMLLQLPVFFAFYKILYVSVELRGAPWIAWITDLSAKDPYYILPIIMGITQFAQQWMMPATGSPAQRRVMMLMPLFFTVLFAGFPSGLVVYWLTNNLLQIGQQAFYNRLLPATADASQGAGPRKGKAGKKSA